MQVMLDGQLFRVYDAEATPDTSTFVPVLEPLDSKGNFDGSVFSGFRLGKRVMMYTLLMDDVPVNQFLVSGEPESYKKGAKLSITDKFFGEDYLIAWEIIDGLAITAAPILTGITAWDIYNNGYQPNRSIPKQTEESTPK